MRRILIVPIILALLVAAVAGTACVKKEGEVPILKVGNQWVLKMVSDNIDYEVTIEVTGEDMVNGKDCYVTTWSFAPALYGYWDTATVKMDKATQLELKAQMIGTLMGLPYSVVAVSSYTFAGDPMWPLVVGRETLITDNSTNNHYLHG